MPEKKLSGISFSGTILFFADLPTRFFDGPATKNKLFPKGALMSYSCGMKIFDNHFDKSFAGFNCLKIDAIVVFSKFTPLWSANFKH